MSFIFMNGKGQYLTTGTRETRASPLRTCRWVGDVDAAEVFRSEHLTQFSVNVRQQQKWDGNITPIGSIVACARVEVVRTITITDMKGI